MTRSVRLSELREALQDAIRAGTAPSWLAEAMARCYADLDRALLLGGFDSQGAGAAAARAEQLLESFRSISPSGRHRFISDDG